MNPQRNTNSAHGHRRTRHSRRTVWHSSPSAPLTPLSAVPSLPMHERAHGDL